MTKRIGVNERYKKKPKINMDGYFWTCAVYKYKKKRMKKGHASEWMDGWTEEMDD
jgi:hypothetical protein